MRLRLVLSAWLGAAVIGKGSALGQAIWTAVRLHPDGTTNSWVYAVSGPRQGGESLSDHIYPTLWEGSAGSATLIPERGLVRGMDGGDLVGTVVGVGAVLWHDSGATMVALQPPGVFQSGAAAISGNEQVGGIRFEIAPGQYRNHGGLWHGSADSWVDLTPPNTFESVVTGTDGVHQGGYINPTELGGIHYAALWSGSAASFLNLNPPGAGGSEILGMSPGQQVGVASTGINAHATIWSGTAASALDVHPFPGFGVSRLYATTGSIQVGVTNVPGHVFPLAGVWFGTAASYVNLHDFLPPGYSDSTATSVTVFDGRIIVGGYASDPFGRAEAFIWTRDVPAPSAGLVVVASMLWGLRRARPQCA